MSKKERFYLIYLSITVIIALIGAIAAFLLFGRVLNNEFQIGDVVVNVEAYYEKDSTVVPIDITLTNGIIELNVTNPEELEHYNNFRVNILVYSTVDTYFRVSVAEQFTLTYLAGSKVNVVAVAKDDFSKFAYNFTDFYDNRLYDNFFYYKSKVKRVDEVTPLRIEFIGELPEIDYHPIYQDKYKIHIGFYIDAVQYLQGPEENWGLAKPPWNSNGEW